ncbi:MAG TPA: ROK family protein [Chthoniobacterales bacterium]
MTLLGIDIGGTGIKGALVNVKTGELVSERFRLATPQPALPNAVADAVQQIVEHFKYTGPTGVTFPAVVKEGVIYSAANVDKSWIGTNAGDLFRQHLGGPVSVVNDADAAGVAEVRFGAGKNRSGVVILLTLGTGIGSAIFLDGKLLPNTEFGHLQIRGKDAEKRASEKVREDKKLSWRQWSKRLSEFLEQMEKLFSPDLFILGGGVSKKAD